MTAYVVGAALGRLADADQLWDASERAERIEQALERLAGDG